MHRFKSKLRRLLGRPDVDAADQRLPMLAEVLEEADRLRPSWRGTQLDLRLAGVPLNDEEDDDEPLTKKEADKLRKAIATKDREVRDKDKEITKLEAKAESQDERIAALEEKQPESNKDGNGSDDKRFEKLEARLEKAEAKTEEAESKRETAEKRSTIIEVATRLRFRNPKRAVALLDSDDLTDEDSIESALERIATEEPYMVSTKKQRTVEEPKKPKTKPGKKPAEDDGEDSKDEPKGKDRIRAAYGETEADGSEGGSEGGDEGESD